MDKQAQNNNGGCGNKNTHLADPEGTPTVLQAFFAVFFNAERDGGHQDNI